jgi:hypothetical protein
MSPWTSLQARGLTKKEHTAQLNIPRGAAWYLASAFDIGCKGGGSARAGTAALAPAAKVAVSSARRVNVPMRR